LLNMQYAGEKYDEEQLRIIQELTKASLIEIINTIQLSDIHIETIIKCLTTKEPSTISLERLSRSLSSATR
jgi:hypothetical protein